MGHWSGRLIGEESEGERKKNGGMDGWGRKGRDSRETNRMKHAIYFILAQTDKGPLGTAMHFNEHRGAKGEKHACIWSRRPWQVNRKETRMRRSE